MRRLLGLLLILAVALAACGKGEYMTPADARLEARLASDLSSCPLGRAEGEAEREADEAELRATLKAAEHLPRVVKLRSDARARQRMRKTVEKNGGFESARAVKDVDSYYRLSVKVYEDAKALGVHCLSRPKRSSPELPLSG